MTGDHALRAANLVAFAAVLWLNGLAGSGALSGESIGVIANDYPSYFLPADYTFGIWGLIYLALAGFVIYQATPLGRRSPATRLGAWFMLSCALNVTWIVAFSYRHFALALVAMAALLATLVALHEQALSEGAELDWRDHLFVVQPFVLYLAWISVALISNVFQFITYVDWRGFGIPGAVWSVAMMAVAAALGLFMLSYRRAWLFPVVVAWALAGIGVRFLGTPLVGWTAIGLAVVCVAAPLGWLLPGADQFGDPPSTT